MNSIGAGKLNCRISFLKPVRVNDGYPSSPYELDFKRWASIDTAKSTESEQSGAVRDGANYVITTRYTNKITQEHRIAYKGKTYEILGTPENVNFSDVLCKMNVKEVV